MKITSSMTVRELLDNIEDYSEEEASGEVLNLILDSTGTWELSNLESGEIYFDNENVIYD